MDLGTYARWKTPPPGRGHGAQNSIEGTEETHDMHTIEQESSAQVEPAGPPVVPTQLQRVLLVVLGTILLDYAYFVDPATPSRDDRSQKDTLSDGSGRSSAGTTRMVVEACESVLNALSVRSRRPQRVMQNTRQSLETKRSKAGDEVAARAARSHHKQSLQHAAACAHEIGKDLMILQRSIAEQYKACRRAWGTVQALEVRSGMPAALLQASSNALWLEAPEGSGADVEAAPSQRVQKKVC